MKFAALLTGCYRLNEAADPEIFLGALVATLTCYPEEIVRAVCDPRFGLPSKCKFLPTICEVREACEARLGPQRAEEARLRRERERVADMPAPIDDVAAERRKAFIAEMRRTWASAEVEVTGGIRLADMDARRCNGEMRDRVVEALQVDIAGQVERNVATPVTLSPPARKVMGLPALPPIEEDVA